MLKSQDEQTFIKNTKSMQKMQDIADRLASTTPELTKFINPDAILKPTKMQNELGPSGKKGDNYESKNKKKQIQTNQLMNKSEMSAQDWINKCQELSVALSKEQERTNQLQLELAGRQERYVNRELEYRKTIEELQQELRSKTALDQNDKRVMENIYRDHNKIVEGINNIQLRTSKILVDQERDIIRFFNNKINEIKKQFEEERVKKGKNDEEYIVKENQLISELEWIKNIAQKIDNENHTLMAKYKELQTKYETQENDREMLLKELIMKKKKNAILKSQIEQYEKLVREAQQANEDQMEGQSLEGSQQDFNNRQSNQAQVRIRSTKNGQVQTSQVKTIRSQQQEDALSKNLSANMLSNDQQSRYDKTIKILQQSLKKEQIRVRELKQLYVKEIENKTILEKILKKCIDDIKEEIIQIRGEARIQNRGKRNKNEEPLEREDRDKLIERLLNNEKILTLLYDKTFYPDKKQVEFLNEEQEQDDNYNIEDQF